MAVTRKKGKPEGQACLGEGPMRIHPTPEQSSRRGPWYLTQPKFWFHVQPRLQEGWLAASRLRSMCAGAAAVAFSTS
jgi:hypothetical protein